MIESQGMEIVGIITALAAQTWLIIKYLLDRMDQKLTAERDERIKNEEHSRKELADVKDQYVRREDYNRHVDNMEKQIAQVGQAMGDLQRGMNQRLDTIMAMLVQKLTGTEGK